MAQVQISGVTWDLSQEFCGVDDPRIELKTTQLTGLLKSITEKCSTFEEDLKSKGTLQQTAPEKLAQMIGSIFHLRDEARTILADVITYCTCVLSVDGTNLHAKKILSQYDTLDSELKVAIKPLQLWFMLGAPEVVDALLQFPVMVTEEFAIKQLRKLRDQSLSLEQEALLETMEVHGPVAFGRLYDDLTSTMKCVIGEGEQKEELGLATAANQLMSADENLRRLTYQGIQRAFREREDSFAAIINGITGWRQNVLKIRSHRQPQHYLNPALHMSHISRATLDAMMDATYKYRHIGQKALKLQARLLGKSALDPWDLAAPCPPLAQGASPSIPFDQGMTMIEKAFGQLHPEMGEFVRMMAERLWIDSSTGPNKRPGAYCTEFLGSREPRVYMTYSGSLSNVSTLAHELGHALHFWLMRDLPLPHLSYPMTLAETASIFGESLLSDHLFKEFRDNPSQLLTLLWEAAGDAAVFLVNIPARFAMECAFNDHRARASLTPEDLCRLTEAAWHKWYEDSLSQPNPMFWASKLHFSIPGLSFYNFPYTFGYLFSLSVFARKDEYGAEFFHRYRNLLRDTGKMTAEDVAQKHLGADITNPTFWESALGIVEKRVTQFEHAVKAVLTRGP